MPGTVTPLLKEAAPASDISNTNALSAAPPSLPTNFMSALSVGLKNSKTPDISVLATPKLVPSLTKLTIPVDESILISPVASSSVAVVAVAAVPFVSSLESICV